MDGWTHGVCACVKGTLRQRECAERLLSGMAVVSLALKNLSAFLLETTCVWKSGEEMIRDEVLKPEGTEL